ncbi:hypothetical protein [Pseudaminobacter sp. NGMCC 1.201702]|uniref:hypothetical protein n=1 Tax=Pseudaminobacter sp. NGMCC 1.201702 TaxID=3391825 RepID=UPI0039EFC419
MANEFEKHIGMERDDTNQLKASNMHSRAEDQMNQTTRDARETVRENPGTFTTLALLVGTIGFVVGWVCGQSSARSDHYWR